MLSTSPLTRTAIDQKPLPKGTSLVKLTISLELVTLVCAVLVPLLARYLAWTMP